MVSKLRIIWKQTVGSHERVEQEYQEYDAATRIQAVQRGKLDRTRSARRREQTVAATRIQARHRGRIGRRRRPTQDFRAGYSDGYGYGAVDDYGDSDSAGDRYENGAGDDRMDDDMRMLEAALAGTCICV